MNRKGQGLSVNIIILIALGLLILVIAVLLVNRSGKNLSENATSSCISKGGICKSSCDTLTNKEIAVPEANADCKKTADQANTANYYCCRYNFGGETTQ